MEDLLKSPQKLIIQKIRVEMLKIFDRVVREKRRDCKYKREKTEINITKQEEKGLKSLQQRVASGELIVTETDKSKRFCIMTREQYVKSGEKHTSKDVIVGPDQFKKVQKCVNSHCEWLSQIFKCGENWQHNDRIVNSMSYESEAVAPLYLLIKDHKG